MMQSGFPFEDILFYFICQNNHPLGKLQMLWECDYYSGFIILNGTAIINYITLVKDMRMWFG